MKRCGSLGTDSSHVPDHFPLARDERDQPEFVVVARETISPELALVDPELGARARSTLPDPPATPLRPYRATPAASMVERDAVAPGHDSRPYPLWARVTAALWLLVIGVLIGGAAIPHAQDKPRLIPKQDEPQATVCKAPATTPAPTGPSTRFGFP